MGAFAPLYPQQLQLRPSRPMLVGSGGNALCLQVPVLVFNVHHLAAASEGEQGEHMPPALAELGHPLDGIVLLLQGEGSTVLALDRSVLLHAR